MKIIHFIYSFLLISSITYSQSLQTPFEKTAGKQTATYNEILLFFKALDRQFSDIILIKSDLTDAGVPLTLIVFSKDGRFDPKMWKKEGKLVILINNGIHPGEPDGIDATMMLMRDLATGKIAIPTNMIIAAIPVYNIGGALNRNSFSRVNQQGPESYGFRGNAQNLDLNRDFTKLDSKNAIAFTKIFHYLQPDILIDNHVSDGADFEYTMTLLSTQHNKLGEPAASLLHKVLEPALNVQMQKANWPMTPYVNFESGSPNEGWTSFYDAPRYSSGYAALFQTIGFMPETHMLKPFKQRVEATYALMRAMMQVVAEKHAVILQTRKEMIQRVMVEKTFTLGWLPDTSYYEMIPFKGYEAGYKKSGVTGQNRLFYDRNKPVDKLVKYYNKYVAANQITAPKNYLLPQGWWAVTDRLKLNNVKMTRLQRDTGLVVECYHINEYSSLKNPYEKHHKNYNVKVSSTIDTVYFRAGDYVIPCNQPSNRYIVEMLEPTGDDSFFAWNFFDAILQQKEGYSNYRWEDVAATYLQQNPDLRLKLEDKKKTDPTFAASADAQLNFVYKNSPWYEPAHLRYPVYRWNPQAIIPY